MRGHCPATLKTGHTNPRSSQSQGTHRGVDRDVSTAQYQHATASKAIDGVGKEIRLLNRIYNLDLAILLWMYLICQTDRSQELCRYDYLGQVITRNRQFDSFVSSYRHEHSVESIIQKAWHIFNGMVEH